MNRLQFSKLDTVLCLGAHADDIEIGCGGTLLKLIAEYPHVRVHWVVFSAADTRRSEALASADGFLAEATHKQVRVEEFRDSYFPVQYEAIKQVFHEVSRTVSPDLILTHRRDDAHQDHRVLADLTWCAFRDHAIWEYEIPKYEGDLGHPNLFVPLPEPTCRRKIALLHEAFVTQREKPWFKAETFWALFHLRGLECRSPSGCAEAFHCRKLLV